MNVRTGAKRLAWATCALSLISLAGCGGDSASKPSTEEEIQSFKADPSKMPADASKYMKGGAGAQQGAPPAAPAVPPPPPPPQ